MTMIARHFLFFVLLAFPFAAAAQVDPNDAPYGTAGTLMLKELPPCIVEDWNTAYNRCLPVRASSNASAIVRHDAFLARGKFLMHLRQPEEAQKELDLAIAAMPTSVEALHLAARLAITTFMDFQPQALLTVAESYIARAVAIAPHNADVRATEAHIIQYRRGKDAAIAAYGYVLDLQPKHAFALTRRGLLHREHGDYLEALKDYDGAVAETPVDGALRYARAELLMEMDRPRAALEDLDAAINVDQYDIRSYEMRAGVHRRLGNLEAALEDLNTIVYGPKGTMALFLNQGEKQSGFLMQRAFVLSDLGRSSEAADDMLKAIKIGGKQKLLRLQIFLRQKGHDVTLDGAPSDAMKAAIESCFRQEQCRLGFSQKT